jgi:NADH-quinone oxidoreductase subunit L
VFLTIVLAPLAAAIVAGFFGKQIGRAGAHSVTIIGVAISFGLSLYVLKGFIFDGAEPFNESVYRWALIGSMEMEVGFLVDQLTALMMAVVTFVSLAVHVYTIGYMHDDPGYQRFFSYISLFTFAMLMLVMANNLLQLFFGWEAVGVVSYLLIGFWYKRPTAIFANMKAFLVNRVGDFGFLLGIATLALFAGSLDYATIFGQAEALSGESMQILPGRSWSVLTVACIGLFIGAMGKSAQVPLHVWLPDSMEGPTPISALIHAATMVTAGIFMVARMSPLFEHSTTALSFIIIIGATTAFFTGLLGLVQNDIKRVVAYSTLSQLGYMTVALGASAYAAGIFHLMTHAFFKALLFLAAGSVIIALHHEQDMRKMGGLKKYLPITYWTSLIGTLALVGFPGFSGFFSKDALIEAVHASTTPGAGFAYWCVLLGVFVTALYSFRLFFMVFHGKERIDHHAKEHLHEPPWVVWVPLVALAIPSVLIGWFTIEPVLFGEFFGESIFVLEGHEALAHVGEEFHGSGEFVLHAFTVPGALYLAIAGALTAWFLYIRRPDLPAQIREAVRPVYRVLDNKYYFDWFNENVLAPATRGIGAVLWKAGDRGLIDGLIVNGSARTVGVLSNVVKRVQTGFLYHYAFVMVVALVAMIGWFVLRG